MSHGESWEFFITICNRGIDMDWDVVVQVHAWLSMAGRTWTAVYTSLGLFPRCQLGSAPGSGPSTQMVTPGEATHRPDGDGGGGEY